jgi:plasmid stabilization system protein ParE
MTRKRRVAAGSEEAARKPFEFFWTDRALADLDAIADFIAAESPAAAERWVQELMATAERAALAPYAGRRGPELARDDVREVFKSSYRIIYRTREDSIEILSVFEGHRLFPDGL